MSQNHQLPLRNDTLVGSFSPDHMPILEIDPGDSITVSTLDGDWLVDIETGPPARHGAEWPGRRQGVDDGHALVGPIAVSGAHPGMTLSVRTDRVETGSWGWSRAGGRNVALDVALGIDRADEHYLRWDLAAEEGIAVSSEGHRVRMAPFLGVIGTTPDLPGLSSTHPPRRTGGNIDCRELTAGSTLLLPIERDGALLLIGDGHAAQGDGEAGSTAIECPMRSVTLTIDLLPDMHLAGPRAITDDGWITFGFNESLDDAAYLALADMVSLVQERFGYGRAEAVNVCSQIVDLRITQIVNGVKGVHAFLPRTALELLPVRKA